MSEPIRTDAATRTDDRGREITLSFDVMSEGTHPVLLVNGLGSPRVSFQPGFCAELAARDLAVVRFDNRDTGHSSRVVGDRPLEATYDLGDMALDAIAVLDAVGWDTAHVVGQSMGGMIAQQLAISHADRVRSLTSFMSSTGNRDYGRPTTEAAAALLAQPPSDREAWIAHRIETERIWASPELWDPDWVRAKAEAMLDHGVDDQGTARQYRALLGNNREDALRALDLPTLVIHGTADTLLTPSAGRRTAELVPGARLVEIEGMGHDLPPGWWPRLADEIGGFVASVG